MSNNLRRFQDAIDASMWAREWVEEIALADTSNRPEPRDRRIENLTFTEGDGGVIAYFADDRPFAVACVLRDAWNYSVVTKLFDAAETKEPT